jgi:hypothetical protein
MNDNRPKPNGLVPVIVVNETGETIAPGARVEVVWAKPNEYHDRWHWALKRIDSLSDIAAQSTVAEH